MRQHLPLIGRWRVARAARPERAFSAGALLLAVTLMLVSPLASRAATPRAITFAPATKVSPVGSQPRGITWGIFRPGARPDLVVANSGENDVSVLPNNGDGTFDPAKIKTYATSGPARAVAVSDMTGDHKPDIVVADGNGYIDVLAGKGDGTFDGAKKYGPVTPRSGLESISLGDFEQDGDLDVVVADGEGCCSGLNGSTTISIFLNDGSGGLSGPQEMGAGGGTYDHVLAARVGYVNGDRWPDIVDMHRDCAGTYVFLNTGPPAAGTFSSKKVTNADCGAAALYVRDINRDGKADLLLANGNHATVQFSYGDGRFSDPVAVTVGAGGVAATDLNHDGTIDLIVTDGGQTVVPVANEDDSGPFTIQTATYTDSGNGALSTPDVNGDGLPDVVTANYNSGDVSVLMNTTNIHLTGLHTSHQVWTGHLLNKSCDSEKEEGASSVSCGGSAETPDALDASLHDSVRVDIATPNPYATRSQPATQYHLERADATLFIKDGWKEAKVIPQVDFTIEENFHHLPCVNGGQARYIPPWGPFPMQRLGDDFLFGHEGHFWEQGTIQGRSFKPNANGNDVGAAAGSALANYPADARLQFRPIAFPAFGQQYTATQTPWIPDRPVQGIGLSGHCGYASGASVRARASAGMTPTRPAVTTSAMHKAKLPRVAIDGRRVAAPVVLRAISFVASLKHARVTSRTAKRGGLALVILDALVAVEAKQHSPLPMSLVRPRVKRIANIYSHASPQVLRTLKYVPSTGPAAAKYILHLGKRYQRIFTVRRFQASIVGSHNSSARAATWLRRALGHHTIRVTGVRLGKVWAVVRAMRLTP